MALTVSCMCERVHACVCVPTCGVCVSVSMRGREQHFAQDSRHCTALHSTAQQSTQHASGFWLRNPLRPLVLSSAARVVNLLFTCSHAKPLLHIRSGSGWLQRSSSLPTVATIKLSLLILAYKHPTSNVPSHIDTRGATATFPSFALI